MAWFRDNDDDDNMIVPSIPKQQVHTITGGAGGANSAVISTTTNGSTTGQVTLPKATTLTNPKQWIGTNIVCCTNSTWANLDLGDAIEVELIEHVGKFVHMKVASKDRYLYENKRIEEGQVPSYRLKAIIEMQNKGEQNGEVHGDNRTVEV